MYNICSNKDAINSQGYYWWQHPLMLKICADRDAVISSLNTISFLIVMLKNRDAAVHSRSLPEFFI